MGADHRRLREPRGDHRLVNQGSGNRGLDSFVDYVEVNGDTFCYAPAPAVPETKDDCKDDGYADYGFANQGQCIQCVNTGQ